MKSRAETETPSDDDPAGAGDAARPAAQTIARTAAPAAAPDLGFDLDAFLPYRLVRLADAVSAEFAALYGARFGLTTAEWRVLAHLSQQPAVGVREIHARVALDKPKITRAAQRLAAAGLVTKAAGTDRRLVSLTLTPAGHALMAELVPLALAAEAEALDALTPDEAASFRDLVEKLLAARA